MCGLLERREHSRVKENFAFAAQIMYSCFQVPNQRSIYNAAAVNTTCVAIHSLPRHATDPLDRNGCGFGSARLGSTFLDSLIYVLTHSPTHSLVLGGKYRVGSLGHEFFEGKQASLGHAAPRVPFVWVVAVAVATTASTGIDSG